MTVLLDTEDYWGPHGLTPEFEEFGPIDPNLCPHNWETKDDSFDHEFGTEMIVYQECSWCGAQKEFSDVGEDL